MRIERSCGTIIYRVKNDNIEFLILKSNKNNYTVPKGHIIKGEDKLECALRETLEETGLKVDIEKGFKKSYSHNKKNNKVKVITLFLARYNWDKIEINRDEIISYQWLNIDEIQKLPLIKKLKIILVKTHKYLNCIKGE